MYKQSLIIAFELEQAFLPLEREREGGGVIYILSKGTDGFVRVEKVFPALGNGRTTIVGFNHVNDFTCTFYKSKVVHFLL